MYSRVNHFSVYYAQLIGILLLTTAISCRKKACDEIAPTIQITTPTTGEVFYYQNTIPIEALITDDQRLESVTVEVTDAQNNRYLASQAFNTNDNRFELNHTIVHNDLYLSSGNYYVRITANDGENEQVAFREIQLIEAPRRIERIFTVSSQGSLTTIDTLHNESIMPCIDFNSAYRFGGVESRTRQLAVTGASPASLMVLDIPFFLNIPAPFPTSNDLITAFHHDQREHQFFWGMQSGDIWTTSTNGTQLFYASPVNSTLSIITSSPSHIIAISGSPSESTIHVLRRNSGIEETSLLVDWEIKGAVYLTGESGRILLLGNQNGAAHFAWLNLTTSAINEVFNFYESSAVQSTYSCENNDFIVIHDAGIARYYNLLDNYTLSTSVHPNKVVYDDLENEVWAITPQALYRMDGAGQLTLQTIPATNLVDAWIQYNK